MPVSDSVNREILKFFSKLDDKTTDYINCLIVSSFVKTHALVVKSSSFLNDYIINSDDLVLKELMQIITQSSSEFEMEELVEVFEFVVSPADKEVNGAIYTPAYIRDFIVKRVLSRYEKETWSNLLYADLSCGCGGFFYSLLRIIRDSVPDLNIGDFVNNCILGIDIKDYSVERTKILLALYALQEGEDLTPESFNVFCQNTLSNDFVKLKIVCAHNGIDVVIGNPPYVSSSRISEENRRYLKNWEVSKTGKSDLYLPFFQLGLECLKEGGILGYITVNTFFRSLNGYAFRSYLSRKGYDCSIVDFGADQLFHGCTTYTCICVISKNSTGMIHYHEATKRELECYSDDCFEDINYASLDDQKGWLLRDNNTVEKIRAIESVGKPLGEIVMIKNGFATLRNSIYLIRPRSNDKFYLYFEKNHRRYKVEKGICRRAIKANLVRKEEDLQELSEFVIFPYRFENGKLTVIEEDSFKMRFPYAYSYLSDNREELSKRDKGHKAYPKWYSYGRSQALQLKGKRLLFPHICDKPCFIFCEDESLLYHDGYAIFAQSQRQLEVVRRVLSSSIFWYYITKTSKPYSGGFFSLEKRYIKHFGVPEFTKEQEDELVSLVCQEQIDVWLSRFYESL